MSEAEAFRYSTTIRKMMSDMMLNEERRMLFHDGRKRWATVPAPLMYPIEYDEDKCKDKCLCHLAINEEEPCQSTTTNVRKVIRSLRSSRSTIMMTPFRVRCAASRWLTSLAERVSPSSTVAGRRTRVGVGTKR